MRACTCLQIWEGVPMWDEYSDGSMTQHVLILLQTHETTMARKGMKKKCSSPESNAFFVNRRIRHPVALIFCFTNRVQWHDRPVQMSLFSCGSLFQSFQSGVGLGSSPRRKQCWGRVKSYRVTPLTAKALAAGGGKCSIPQVGQVSAV